MKHLITVEEFAQFRNISQKLDQRKIEEAISLAQQSDLVEILGDLYFDILENSEEEEYKDIMNGSSFEYNGVKYVHAGIKAMLADYVYARFIYMININLTPFGAVSKSMDNSESVDRATIRDLSKQAQVDAGIKYRFIEMYISANPSVFKRCCKKYKTGFSGLNISRL